MEKILIIDDDRYYGETLEILFRDLNYNTLRAESGEIGKSFIKDFKPDLIVTDLKMPGVSGIDILIEAKKFDPKIQVLILTAFEDVDSTIEAMQQGAYDYIEKNAGLDKLTIAVNRAIQSRRLNKKACLIVDEGNSRLFTPDLLIGKTPPMREIFKKIGKVASNKVTILIQGESGTGKELISKVIHHSGCSKNEPFIAVNCSALSESLLESELFGHERGSFTGAIRTKIGKFELAKEGTIFLDEISELSLNLQVKLLRVIQERTIERVGGEFSIPVKARIIAATNRKLADLVEENKFRRDLFFRLNVFNIDVPPLRERIDDIPLLVIHLLKKINRELHKNVSKIPYSVMETLESHNWTGNVRELENTLLQAVILAKSDIIEAENIFIRKSPEVINSDAFFDNRPSLEELEKNYIKKVLDELNWNKKEASKILGIAKTTLYNKIENYQLQKE